VLRASDQSAGLRYALTVRAPSLIVGLGSLLGVVLGELVSG
jgi:hypothetical protein